MKGYDPRIEPAWFLPDNPGQQGDKGAWAEQDNRIEEMAMRQKLGVAAAIVVMVEDWSLVPRRAAPKLIMMGRYLPPDVLIRLPKPAEILLTTTYGQAI